MTKNKIEKYEINFKEIFNIIYNWKSKIILFILLLSFSTIIVLYSMPNIYYSYVTAIPTNSSLNDKAYIFNDKIDGLYSSFGNDNDLDKLYAIANLDTTLKYLIYKFDLINHYKINQSDKNITVQKTLKKIKSDYINVEKIDGGLLRIHVWDENADTATLIANEMMSFIEKDFRNLQLEYNKANLESINKTINNKFETIDSIKKSKLHLDEEKLNIKQQFDSENLLSNLKQLETLKQQFEITLQFQQPSLRIVETATPNYKKCKPNRIFLFFSVFILGLLGFIFFILIIENIKKINLF